MNRIFGFLIITLILTSAPAWAAPPSADLVERAPSSAKVLIGVNLPAVRQSFLFQDVLDFIRKQPANADVLGFVLQGGFVDIASDVDGILIATPASQMPAPGQQIPKQDVALIVRAKFDRAEVLNAAKTRYASVATKESGGAKIYDTGAFKFVFIDDSTLGLVDAESDYEKKTLEAFVDAAKSVATDKKMKSVMKRVNTASGIWMASTQAPGGAGGMKAAPIKDVALAIDITGGLKVDMRSEMTDEAAAKQTFEQLEKLKNDSAKSPMVQGLGAGPLLVNMKLKLDKTRMDMTTRMTKSEFKILVDRLKALQGGGMPPGAGTSPPAQAPTEVSPKDGANADFN